MGSNLPRSADRSTVSTALSWANVSVSEQVTKRSPSIIVKVNFIAHEDNKIFLQMVVFYVKGNADMYLVEILFLFKINENVKLTNLLFLYIAHYWVPVNYASTSNFIAHSHVMGSEEPDH